MSSQIQPSMPTASAAPLGHASGSTVTSVADRIAAAASNWQRKLLDLSKRNRALNFRVNKVSTVTIVDEQPAEVFRQLYIREQSMKFKAAPEPEAATADAAPSEAAGDASTERISVAAGSAREAEVELTEDLIEDEDESVAADFAPYDPTRLGERHTDDWLQTSSTPDALDRSLRRLDEQARLSIEEQGVNTLFIALGMLYYRDSVDSDIVLRAPLVLLPVELSRRSARSGYEVRAADDEPMVNPALAEYLRIQYGIALPDVPESSVMPDDYDLQTLLSAVSAKIRDKEAWAVKTDVYLGLFSFQKFVMYKDLETNAEKLRAHRLIRQLVTRAGDGQAPTLGLPAEIREMELDREFPPERTHQVVDADSSQLRAIAASARRHDLVIEGPPGTGKSQTITNLIAQALSDGKSVLFVAEKMAALRIGEGSAGIRIRS